MPLDRAGEGFVSHTRIDAAEHQFCYRVWMLLVELERLPAVHRLSRLLSVDRFNLLSIVTDDWLIEFTGRSLRQRIDSALSAHGFGPPHGPVLLLHQPASFGVSFNPVRFAFCLDDRGGIEYVLAEINNTPWDERHTYVLKAEAPAANVEFEFDKRFHVSPFNGMAQRYHWRFELGERRLRIAMTVLERGAAVMHAGVALRLEPLSRRAIRRGALRFPFQSALTLSRIYRQAARLWLRGTRFYDHPKLRTEQ